MRKYSVWFLVLCFWGQAVCAERVWKDASGLVIGGKGWSEGIGAYGRLPDAAEGKVPASVWSLSAHTAGLTVEFETDSDWIGLRWTLTKQNLSMPHMPATGVSGIDLYRKYKERVADLGRTLRKAHPEAPIVFVEQSHFRGPFPTASSKAQRKGIETLRKQGVGNIRTIPGDELIGKDGDGTVDGCHPNDLGMARHAEVLLPVLKSLIE